MQCRNSPLTKSPPPNLPKIPGVTSPEKDTRVPEESKENGHEPIKADKKAGGGIFIQYFHKAGGGIFIQYFHQCGTLK